MYLPLHGDLTARSTGDSSSIPSGLWVGVGVAAFLIAVLLVFVISRRLRLKDAEPRLLPGNYLKALWWGWNPGKKRFIGDTASISQRQNVSTTSVNHTNPQTAMNGNDSAPQRGHSIRSIITLPSYSRLPKEEEQVIGREGERADMDMVIEFPETAEEEEERREGEMESLYQIRLRRREEIAEREERQRQRREALADGDFARLQQITRDSQASRELNQANGTSARAMLTQHQSQVRHQRFSSVGYAGVGQVRHDGSRIRANSAESEQRPLLHNDSRNSTHSILTTNSQAPSSGLTLTPTLSESIHSGRDTPTEGADGDLSSAHIPPPPSYDDYEDWTEAPAYESPISGSHAMHLVPQIRVDTGSPANSTPATPAPDDHNNSRQSHTESEEPQLGISVIHHETS
ncbi:hypothetical protein PISL3812_07167 [Talaromyces islandicus]|uniref:Uncharacterized protein n=1 Tax=Talaromyces islandicus TaxID=28573 RepID=A0A0U1M563_TALIS|nr:hypothetical protein PISL3812_07167 [Talaromyces islandicus]